MADGGGELSEQEIVDADALIANIKEVPFGKYLRGAVLFHLILILITSPLYIYNTWINPPEEEQTEAEAATEETSSEEGEASESDESNMDEMDSTGEEEPAEEALKREKTALEKRVETLPEDGEVPTSGISLEDDL